MRRVRGIVVLLAAVGLVIALPGIAQAQDHEPEGTNDVRITIVYDNTVYDGVNGIGADWGFSALIEIGGQQVLFDTGTKGLLLLENMAALDIDPSLIDVIVLSHDHGDHTGGLETLLTVGEATPERIIVLPSVPEATKAKMADYATVIDTEPLRHLLGFMVAYLLLLLAGGSALALAGFAPQDALFESASAIGTVGLSSGITDAHLPTWAKLVLSLEMWAGRLEVLPVLVLVYPGTWKQRRRSR